MDWSAVRFPFSLYVVTVLAGAAYFWWNRHRAPVRRYLSLFLIACAFLGAGFYILGVHNGLPLSVVVILGLLVGVNGWRMTSCPECGRTVQRALFTRDGHCPRCGARLPER